MARIGVVGAGRVGAVLAAALRDAGHDVGAVAGASDATLRRIADLLPGVPVRKPSAVARDADLLVLAVPDDALAHVVDVLSAAGAISAGQRVLHTSGRHGTAVLAPATRHGASVAAVHPAMSFSGTGSDLARLHGVTVGCTAEEGARPWVEALAADLGARPLWLDEAQRALYHAALTHGANHLVTLVAQSADVLRSAGVDEPAAVLGPLLQAALGNALAHGDAALTGPVVRGDVATVRDHLRVLADTSLEVLDSYVAMARATAAHAVLDGRLTPARAAEVVETLEQARGRAHR